jgi:hypothetical protein
VFAIGLRKALGQKKTGSASHGKILRAVEPQETLVLEGDAGEAPRADSGRWLIMSGGKTRARAGKRNRQA